MKDAVSTIPDIRINGHERLRVYMMRNNVSMVELARCMGCSPAWLSKMFSKSERPTDGYYLTDLCAAVAQILAQRKEK